MTLYPIVILAGGLATRMKPLTDSLPKSLIPVNGKPFIFYQLENLERQGASEVIICIGHMGKMIQQEVERAKIMSMNIRWSFDGDQPLGTGGAVMNALSQIPNEYFFILNGDSYLECDYKAVQDRFQRQHKKGQMTVFRNLNQCGRSNVLCQDGEIKAYEKNNLDQKFEHIDYGLSILSKQAFSHCKPNEHIDMGDVMKYLIAHHQLASYEVNKRFYEIGSFEGLNDFIHYLDTVSQ